VLEISEDSKVSSNISVEYTLKGVKKRAEFVESLRFYNRNAITWDDDRKVAAFVTPKDPAIQKFSKLVAAVVKDRASSAINANLRMAIALHESLRLYGINYVIDPSTPYAEVSSEEKAIDYVQFPSQTLEVMAGDCDDLSVLYSALLESVGISTAFVTVPQHIFVAFSTDLSVEQASKAFSSPGDVLVIDGTAWIPLEVTELTGGFLAAWQAGARLWREYSARNQSSFIPLSKAWKDFEPVGFAPSSNALTIPDKDDIVQAYLTQVNGYVEREISLQGGVIVRQAQTIDSVQVMNRLGVLYARFGKMEEAGKEFRGILDKAPGYVPALVNLGNMLFIQGDLNGALLLFERATRESPDEPSALLGLVRTHYELGNRGEADLVYGRLRALSPQMAQKYTYPGLETVDDTRSAAGGGAGDVVWNED
jgi:tetratricopeptide (TPR) repeat protein